jgi:GPH family glycoside/pentoside/hexuronide:cation symporter
MVSGPLLELTGFNAEAGAEQAASVLINLRIGYIIIPVVALLIALAVLRNFSITRQRAAEIRRELEARRGQV